MTIIVDQPKPAGVPGQTHMLIVGVGSYPWLLGGAHPRGPEVVDGMDQLDSPPISARRFADWCLTTFCNDERPLGAIEMLLSDDATQNYSIPGGADLPIEPATVPNIRRAALDWKARGDANPEDLLVFLFSGHGMSAGTRFALLARDYGEIAARPLLGAVSVEGLIEGMQSCKATRQLYFIDACRVNSGVLLSNTSETGDVLVPKSLPLTRGVQQSVYYATLGGRAAFGLPGAPSLFTASLMNALRGPGARDNDGDWRINTSRLQEALGHFASLLADPVHGQVQTPQSGTQTTFDFHFFKNGPIEVPIYVKPEWHDGDKPPADVGAITISDPQAEVVEWLAPWEDYKLCSWKPSRFESWLTPGKSYTVRLRHADNDSVSEAANNNVSPPYRLIRITRDG